MWEPATRKWDSRWGDSWVQGGATDKESGNAGPQTSRPRADRARSAAISGGDGEGMRAAANSRYGLGTRHCSFLRLTRLKGKPATQMEIQMFGRCFVLPPRARCWPSLSGDSTAGRRAPARASCQPHGPFWAPAMWHGTLTLADTLRGVHEIPAGWAVVRAPGKGTTGSGYLTLYGLRLYKQS